jgi:nitroreductase
LDILEVIKTRRSIRNFEETAIPDALLENVLEAGRWAPSGLNNQPWRFAVVRNPAIRLEISGLTHYSGIVKNAPALIAVFLAGEDCYNRTKDVQAIGACIQNMLLEAHSVGLGCVWLGEIIKSGAEIRKILGLEEDSLELMAVIALGFPRKKPGKVGRKELKDLIVCCR